MLNPGAVREASPRCRFAAHIHYREQVESTNTWARELGRAGEPDGTLAIADAQTAGRGRRQRAWLSPPRLGLYTSLLLRPPFRTAEAGPAVQLVAGIAVAELVASRLPQAPLLRWPNDCYVHGRKIAGVLVEAETGGRGSDFLVCGIGINVNQARESFPEELRDTATSLRLELGHRVDRQGLLVGLLESLDVWEAVWRRHGLRPIRERWLELSPESATGRVVVQTETGTVEGTADGLTEDGRLRVLDDGHAVAVSVGEVVRLRPA